VFIIIGWFFLQAGLSSNASEAGGVEEALSSLSGVGFAMVALGLLLFGLFSMIEARFRRINDPNVLSRLRALLEGLPHAELTYLIIPTL
jgi:hypothetical protein